MENLFIRYLRQAWTLVIGVI